MCTVCLVNNNSTGNAMWWVDSIPEGCSGDSGIIFEYVYYTRTAQFLSQANAKSRVNRRLHIGQVGLRRIQGSIQAQ